MESKPMKESHVILTNGQVFRIMYCIKIGGSFIQDHFEYDILSGHPLEFYTKQEAEEYIAQRLSKSEWREA